MILSIPDVKKNQKVQRILSKAQQRWVRALVNPGQIESLELCGEYGINSILIGRIPEKEKEVARRVIAYLHSLAISQGKKPDRMFAYEFVELLFSVPSQHFVADSQLTNTVSKLQRYHKENNLYVLANTSRRIGAALIPYYDWICPLVFPPTDKDKRLLIKAKSPTLDRIKTIIIANEKWEWIRSFFPIVRCAESDFDIAAEDALWFDFQQSVTYFDRNKLRELGGTDCNDEPTPTDNFCNVRLVFWLYSSFEQDKHGAFINCVCFTASRTYPL